MKDLFCLVSFNISTLFNSGLTFTTSMSIFVYFSAYQFDFVLISPRLAMRTCKLNFVNIIERNF